MILPRRRTMNLFTTFAKHSLPQVEGTLTVRGLRAPVEVIRDRWGVPHIYAQSMEDALFAQGLVHAQDRLWQMDVNRRAGRGRLSGFFGKMTLDLDRFARTVGLARAAQAELDAADPDSLALLDAFVAGVNAWIARGQRPGGQSGHPASSHYFDQFPLWLEGKARPMLWSRAAVEREAEARLWLRPI